MTNMLREFSIDIVTLGFRLVIDDTLAGIDEIVLSQPLSSPWMYSESPCIRIRNPVGILNGPNHINLEDFGRWIPLTNCAERCA
jgi:hypothetical protein